MFNYDCFRELVGDLKNFKSPLLGDLKELIVASWLKMWREIHEKWTFLVNFSELRE